MNIALGWFVCVEVLRPRQPNGVMSSAVSLPNHTFTGQALSSKRLTSIVHIPSPETDNCPSWISGRERMTVENISWSISTKECCRPRRGLNPRPPGLQSDGASNWATEAGSSWVAYTLYSQEYTISRSSRHMDNSGRRFKDQTCTRECCVKRRSEHATSCITTGRQIRVTQPKIFWNINAFGSLTLWNKNSFQCSVN